MQFLVYSPIFQPDDGTPPSPELHEAINNFVQEAQKAGVLVTTGALASQGKRLQRENGRFEVTDGPFVEVKELTAGFAILKTASEEEAIEWSKRFRDIIGDGVSEIVQLYGPE
jgi:hypothetical protein